MKLCDACDSQPAMLEYRDITNGALHSWCRDCSARIVRPGSYGCCWELEGPADNTEARVEWAKGLLHCEVNAMLSAADLPAAVDALAAAIDIPDFVRQTVTEVSEQELAKTA
jgi:hypothetical protein